VRPNGVAAVIALVVGACTCEPEKDIKGGPHAFACTVSAEDCGPGYACLRGTCTPDDAGFPEGDAGAGADAGGIDGGDAG
jgi:hypothetical protein